LQDRLLAR